MGCQGITIVLAKRLLGPQRNYNCLTYGHHGGGCYSRTTGKKGKGSIPVAFHEEVCTALHQAFWNPNVAPVWPQRGNHVPACEGYSQLFQLACSFLETEEGLDVAWERKILIFLQESVHF